MITRFLPDRLEVHLRWQSSYFLSLIHIFAALLLLAVVGVPRSGEAELDMLDVGQGDGCYLQTKEGYHLFVDGRCV